MLFRINQFPETDNCGVAGFRRQHGKQFDFSFVVVIFKDRQDVAVEIFNVLGLEHPSMPQTIFSPGSKKRLQKLILDAFIRKNAVCILLFEGFEIQHVVGDQVQQNTGVAFLKNKCGDDPSPNKNHGGNGKIPRRVKPLRNHDNAGPDQYAHTDHRPPQKRSDHGPVGYREKAHENGPGRIVHGGSQDIGGNSGIHGGKNIKAQQKGQKRKHIVNGMKHEHHGQT